MQKDMSNMQDYAGASVSSNRGMLEQMSIQGSYTVQCFDKDGNIKWSDDIHNLITDEGKKYLLNCGLAGTGVQTYSSAYMGLISSVGYTAVAVGDTAAQINGSNGWKEASTSTNYPAWTGATRGTPSFGAAAKNTNVDKSTSSAVSFTNFTTGGTVKGAIIVINGTTAAGNTTGVLFSAGLFSGGDKIVAVGDTLSCNYTASLT